MAKELSNIDKKILAERITDIFKDLLDDYEINIPNPECDYEYMEDQIIQTLEDFDLIKGY